MIVLKFGGTSVGTAKSIRQVVEIVTRINEPKVVVLSAVSGTTNSLVEINNCIESINKDKALLIVHQLHNSYLNLIGELFKSVEYKERARSFIAAKFNGIKTIIESNEQENTENIIVA
jgi:aspartate kinase